MVRKVRTGFTTVFKKAKTVATIKAVRKRSASFTPIMLTPGKNHAVMITAKVEMIIFRINFMKMSLKLFRQSSVKIRNLVVE
jgi:hypothetical protein